MASPHVAGVAALIIEAHGRGNPRHGYRLDPAPSARSSSAPPPTTPARPAASRTTPHEGRPADWNAACEGTTADNGLYGEGIVNASRRGRPPLT